MALRIAVVGGGAMGSLFAARLADAGHHITLVEIDAARRAQVSAQGVLLTWHGIASRVPVACVTPDALPAGQDVLLLLTKYGALCKALGGTIDRLRGGGCVAAFSNGLGVAEMLAGICAPHSLMIGVTDVAADLRDGIVASDGSGQVTVGLTAGKRIDAANRFVAALVDAGFDVHHVHAIAAAVWHKAAFNAAFNALATITDRPVGQLDTPPGRRIVAAVLHEVAAVARACGIAFDGALVDGRVEAAFRTQGAHLPSMLQDRRAGRATEIEAINGAVVHAGAAVGVPTPVNAALADLMRLTGG